MTVWTWVKLTVCLWLLRRAVKAAGWLLLAALAVAAWPLTLVTAAGYAAGWLRGWPAARLRRAAAASLPMTAVWLAAAALEQRTWPADRAGPGPRLGPWLASPHEHRRSPDLPARSPPSRSPPGWPWPR